MIDAFNSSSTSAMSAPPPAAASSTSSAPKLILPPGASQAECAETFAEEPRIHFSTVTRRWTFEADDGSEWEYDSAIATWLPVVDEALLRKQQAAYSVPGVDEQEPAAPILKIQSKSKKRKEPVDYTSATAPDQGISIKRGKNEKGDASASSSKPAAPRKSKNTAVYVTRLPSDTTAEELATRFARCGVLEEDDEGDPKVKLYARDDGTFSGEALVVYFKEESVALAVAMLDEAELRIGDPATTMSVSQAEFRGGGSGEGSGGANGGEQKPRKTINKKSATKRIGRMQKKLEDWGSGDEFGPSPDVEEDSKAANKNSRVVVLKHMFTLKQLEEDASLLLDLKEDVREECSMLGEVTNVVLYDEEPEGIMTVKFRDPISAQACIIKMQGRFFDGRRVEAFLYSGKNRYKRSGMGDEVGGDSEAAEKKRLDEFAQWLVTEGD